MYWWHGPDTRNDSASTIAAKVFQTILGMNSSKWQQALIDKGLASSADVDYDFEKYVGPVDINMRPNPDKLLACNSEVLNQIKMWGNDDYFTDEQLRDAKEIMRRNAIRQKEKPSAQASIVTAAWCSSSLDYMTDYEKNCQKVTRADIQRLITKYIKGKPYVAGMIISTEMNKELKASENFKPGL
jgi:zinc protease